jgi:hypothetical protein
MPHRADRFWALATQAVQMSPPPTPPRRSSPRLVDRPRVGKVGPASLFPPICLATWRRPRARRGTRHPAAFLHHDLRACRSSARPNASSPRPPPETTATRPASGGHPSPSLPAGRPERCVHRHQHLSAALSGANPVDGRCRPLYRSVAAAVREGQASRSRSATLVAARRRVPATFSLGRIIRKRSGRDVCEDRAGAGRTTSFAATRLMVG